MDGSSRYEEELGHPEHTERVEHLHHLDHVEHVSPMLRMERDAVRFLAGGASGVAEVLATHPIDVLKTRMQANQAHGGTGGLGLRASLAGEWSAARVGATVAGMYRGCVPRVVGVFPMRFVFWGTQSSVHVRLHEAGLPPVLQAALAGAAAGTVQTVIDTPIEVIKTRLIAGPPPRPEPIPATVTSSTAPRLAPPPVTESTLSTRPVSVGRAGAASLFAGFAPNMLRNVGFAVVLATGLYWDGNPRDLSPSERFARGAVAGCMAALATQPLDYVKTKAQLGLRGGSTVSILLNTPFRTLMTGAIPRATLSMAAMGVGATVFSSLEAQLLRALDHPHHHTDGSPRN